MCQPSIVNLSRDGHGWKPALRAAVLIACSLAFLDGGRAHAVDVSRSHKMPHPALRSNPRRENDRATLSQARAPYRGLRTSRSDSDAGGFGPFWMPLGP